MRNAILIGNYGVGNLGDEALREFYVSAFPEIRWTVLSAHPAGKNELPRLPAGIRSLFATPWWRTLRALRRTDAVVFGGGSLFTDIESPFACFLWWLHAAVARMFGKKVYLASQGIGPFKTRIGEWFARRAVAGVAYISVRDMQSAERMKNWRKITKVVQTFDPVFALFQDKKLEVDQKNCLILIPRHNSDETFENYCVNEYEKHHNDSVTILLMHAKHDREQSFALRLKSKFDNATTLNVDTLEDLCRGVSSGRKVVTHRYHGALAALARGVPMVVVTQEGDDKLSSLLPGSGLPIDNPSSLRHLVEEGVRTLRASLAS